MDFTRRWFLFKSRSRTSECGVTRCSDRPRYPNSTTDAIAPRHTRFIDLLHGVVLSTQLCLKVVSLRTNRNRALLLLRQRERAATELDLAYEDLRLFENNVP